MANRKATMTDIRVIIREFVRGTSLREMERKLHISRTSLRAYRDRAEASGKAMVDLLNLEDVELNAIMVKGDGHRSRDADRYAFMMENVEEYAQQMKRKHMTYDVLYADYQKATDNPYGYTQFKAIIQEYEKNHDYKYHNVYEPGREMQFDFAGDGLWIVDRSTGEAVSAIVLVCVLPYSMLSYVTALPSAKMEYLFQALSKAVEYFGGVAEISKTDNMRQWIKKANRYEPTLNEAASQWCLHYGTDLDECRSRKPRDKGPAESLVNQAYRYYYSRICRETFFSIEELNRKLDELNDLYNNRDRKNKTYSRREQFEKEELPYLLPLPSSRFLFKYEKEIIINTTYHFQIGTTEVDNKIVNKVENGMFIALGIILSDDFLKQTTDLLSSLRYSINNISLKRRKVPNYSYEYFNDENSFLMQRLKDTAIIKEREKITMMISDFCALAVIGNM